MFLPAFEAASMVSLIAVTETVEANSSFPYQGVKVT